VSIGLPDLLSFLIPKRAMVAIDRGQTSTGRASGSGCKSGLTRHFEEAMSATIKRQRPKQKRSNPTSSPSYATTVSIAVENLINMIAIFAVSGTVLLGLLVAKYFSV
jgi:hypothetical protein